MPSVSCLSQTIIAFPSNLITHHMLFILDAPAILSSIQLIKLTTLYFLTCLIPSAWNTVPSKLPH
jgi:hypothetical protein